MPNSADCIKRGGTERTHWTQESLHPKEEKKQNQSPNSYQLEELNTIPMNKHKQTREGTLK